MAEIYFCVFSSPYNAEQQQFAKTLQKELSDATSPRNKEPVYTTRGQLTHIAIHTFVYHESPRCPTHNYYISLSPDNQQICLHGLAKGTKMFQELIYIYIYIYINCHLQLAKECQIGRIEVQIQVQVIIVTYNHIGYNHS